MKYKGKKENVQAPFGVDKGPTLYKTSLDDYIEPKELAKRNKYPDFAAGVSSWPGHLNNNNRANAKGEDVELIMDKIKDIVLQRGVRSFLSLHRVLRVMDTDNDNLVNFYEFSKGKKHIKGHFY